MHAAPRKCAAPAHIRHKPLHQRSQGRLRRQSLQHWNVRAQVIRMQCPPCLNSQTSSQSAADDIVRGSLNKGDKKTIGSACQKSHGTLFILEQSDLKFSKSKDMRLGFCPPFQGELKNTFMLRKPLSFVHS